MTVLCFILASWLGSAVPAAAAPPQRPVPEAWKEIWRIFDVDPALAESVVWPEMQQYSYMRDLLETGADSITSGARSGRMDFSIGVFQMKPSFVEKLETAWRLSGLADYYNLPFDTGDDASVRQSRIERMSVAEWQVIYLGMFLRLLNFSYRLDSLPPEEQVRLAANAYNRGCDWPGEGCGSLDSLRVNIDARLFPRVIIPSSGRRRYSYPALCLEHYKTIVE